jgi:hypothetical protein
MTEAIRILNDAACLENSLSVIRSFHCKWSLSMNSRFYDLLG